VNGCLAEAEFFREDGTRFQFKELPLDSWRVEVFAEDDG
jgi:hypothetical protein